MPYEINRQAYASLYGPTTGDRVRLGDTDLVIRVEHDYAQYGDELLVGFGKTIRDGMQANSRLARDSELDLILVNALVIDPVLGIFKGNIGIKDGRIVGIGNAGNPDIADNVDLLIGTNTGILGCEGLIVTPGGIDSHVHLLGPNLMPAAVSAGITTLVAMGSGPVWDVGVNPEYAFQRMTEAFEFAPVNVAFLSRGSSSRPDALRRNVEMGAGGLKIHEDVAAFPEVIDCALSVAEEYDVPVAMHTDGLQESAQLQETVEALRGRTVHAYHVEGAGGGHSPDMLGILREPYVIPSSTNPTNPYTISTVAEHVDMIMTCHSLKPELPEDWAAARSRVRRQTIAAEDVLHDLGAISIMSSDSLGMGRIGETIRRTWQLAHKMKLQRGAEGEGEDDNARVLRYVAKYTINPAITHGIADHLGSLEPGKFADMVIWKPGFFGAKPELVIKGGMVSWAAAGEGNASIRMAQPMTYQPMYGATGTAASSLNITFVSQASLDNGAARGLRTSRLLLPVHQTRKLSRADMVGNTYVPDIEVDPESYEVRVGGKLITCEPATEVALNQLYFIA